MEFLFIILIVLIIIQKFRLFPNLIKFLVEHWLIPVAVLLNKIKDKIESWLNNVK